MESNYQSEKLINHEGDDRSSLILKFYMFFLSVFFLVASMVATIVYREGAFYDRFYALLTSPSKLITDYFALGGLSATLFNVGICGLIANAIIFFSETKTNSTTLAGYFLVIAHCFYGLNPINMLPCIIGAILYCLIIKRPFNKNVHVSLFSTALAPFISEFIFRYANNFAISQGLRIVIIILLVTIFSLMISFIVPALLPITANTYRGYNMYKAGLAIGFLGIFLHAFFYSSFGINTPSAVEIYNPNYYNLKYGYRAFMNGFFIVLFSLSLIMGFVFDKKGFSKYKDLLNSTGYGVDFFDKFKMPVCMINIGIYGLCILAYINIVIILPEIFTFLPKGAGFSGATTGVIIAAITFSADGQQPRTVAPIALGYIIFFILIFAISLALKIDIVWTLSSQAYINAFAFATGLCPFAGKYGWKIGVIAGIMSATICTVTADMHGGFVLYNGGFTAGLTAMVLLPILDYYKINPKHEDDKL